MFTKIPNFLRPEVMTLNIATAGLYSLGLIALIGTINSHVSIGPLKGG
jgi:hypothetical protein